MDKVEKDNLWNIKKRQEAINDPDYNLAGSDDLELRGGRVYGGRNSTYNEIKEPGTEEEKVVEDNSEAEELFRFD
ncbi:hypothetical protein [Candidatus Nanohalococcus occultus]|uniref:Uncharacterized protein n=1 Tax=Candidatus Nanohalococcus occultus TaxID=2978047 RepID=A0ABY8CJ47_9ARCH|nr:hypothetical protein SVXNc_0645 [Candidatus Nanohaloarchaeota archaeon SVXNc]